MRSSPGKSIHLAFPVLLCVFALVASSQLFARTVEWQEGKLIKSEPLDQNKTNSTNFFCLLFNNTIHTVETNDLVYKFIGTPIDFAMAPDRNKLEFRIAKDGRVSVQDKRGHEQQTSLRIYTKTMKISQEATPLPLKAKHRNWRVANITRMQPVLFSFDMPWLLSVPEPQCPLPVVVIRGWAFEFKADDVAFEAVRTSPELLAVAVSTAIRIAEKGKNELYVLDQIGKERKLRIIKKTIQNSVGP